VGAAANKLAKIVWPDRRPPYPEDVLWTLARLSYMALTGEGEDWLLEVASAAVRVKPRRLDYVKGALANASGDREAFFGRYDRLRRKLAPWYRPKCLEPRGPP
jgi:hypothetical protein